jgi:vacuolar-type H+-ATPase subunit F/Vma7
MIPVPNSILYLGPVGAGLGFQLSGLAVATSSGPEAALKRLRRLVKDRTYSLIFVDESLVQDVLPEFNQLNQAPVPTLVLLPNPSHPEHLAATKVNQLMIQAIGSDIFSSNS